MSATTRRPSTTAGPSATVTAQDVRSVKNLEKIATKKIEKMAQAEMIVSLINCISMTRCNKSRNLCQHSSFFFTFLVTAKLKF
jgi:hypothetical protein